MLCVSLLGFHRKFKADVFPAPVIHLSDTSEPMETEPTSQPPLRLPADCSIAGIRAAYDLIRHALRLSHPLEIDCSGVDRADVTAVQLLLSATRPAGGGDPRVRLTAFSQHLKTTFQRAGISRGAMQSWLSAGPNEAK
jgi:ABC-type transporter Mla MlaB component